MELSETVAEFYDDSVIDLDLYFFKENEQKSMDAQLKGKLEMLTQLVEDQKVVN